MGVSSPRLRPGRLDVGVMGAGRVGAVWASALREAGHRVVAASGNSEESTTRIEALLPGVDRTDPDDVARRADLVLVTVPDDAIAGLVSGLAALDLWRPGQIVVHTSGLHGLAVLDPAARSGAVPLAIHPAMTFTGTSLDLSRMRGAAFAVTAPAAMLPIAQALAVEIGGEPFVLPEESRALYHAALVHGANHVATAVAESMALLAAADIEEPGRVLGPLLAASIDGAAREEPGGATALTGPVVRGDGGTIRKHMEALAAHPHERVSYRALARATARLAREGGRLKDTQYGEVMNALEEDE